MGVPDQSPAAQRRPLRRDAAENRDRLLLAANRVFAEQGLEAGVVDIARTAGVGMGTLYRRFPTKDALIEALVAQAMEAIIELAASAQDEPDGTGLEQFLRSSSSYLADHSGCLPRLWSTDHPPVHAARALIAELLAQAKHHGQVREDLTSTDLTVALLSIRGILETTRDLAPTAWRRHLELLIAGMRPTGEPLTHEPVSQTQMDRILTRPADHANVRTSPTVHQPH